MVDLVPLLPHLLAIRIERRKHFMALLAPDIIHALDTSPYSDMYGRVACV